MFFLEALPIDILTELLHYLEDDDIHSLLQFPELGIESLICSVTDVALSYLLNPNERKVRNNATKSVYTDGFIGPNIFKGRYIVLVEVTDIASSLQNFTSLAETKPHLDIRLDIDAPIKQVRDGYTASWNDFIPSMGPSTFTSVIFRQLGYLELKNAIMDPRVFQFPELRSLSLNKCEAVINTGRMFNLPKMTTLTVKGLFASIRAALDFNNSQLFKLQLIDLEDLNVLENINCPTSLLFLGSSYFYDSGSDCRWRSFGMECEFYVRKEHVPLQRLSDVYFGEVETLILGNQNLSLQRVVIPKLKYLDISVAESLEVSQVSFPSLKGAAIEFTDTHISKENLESIDIGFLITVELLKLRNCSDLLLKRSFDNLKKLDIDNPDTFLDSEMKFPKVILLKCSGVQKDKIVCLRRLSNMFPGVTDLHLQIEEAAIAPLNNTLLLSGLQNLIISVSKPTSLKSLNLPYLECMSIQIASSSNSTLELPELAPQLNLLTIEGDGMLKELKPLNYPNLEILVINCNIRNIRLGNKCSRLREINFSKNKQLRSFKCSCTMRNLTFINGREGTPYITDFEKMDAPLLGQMRKKFPRCVSNDWERVKKPTEATKDSIWSYVSRIKVSSIGKLLTPKDRARFSKI